MLAKGPRKIFMANNFRSNASILIKVLPLDWNDLEEFVILTGCRKSSIVTKTENFQLSKTAKRGFFSVNLNSNPWGLVSLKALV